MAKRKLIIIGLDGGTWDIFDSLIDSGRLPNFQSIIEKGIRGNLISTIPPITAVAWSSFQTGVTPGRHGLFDSVEYNKNDLSMRLNNSQSIKAETIWEYLSRCGVKIGLVNVPVTYPPKKINGCVIGGFLSPGVKSQFTYPADLYQKMVKDIGGYNIFIPVNTYDNKGLKGFVDELIYASRKRLEAALWINKNYNPDLLMVHFQDMDALQHKLWGYIDVSAFDGKQEDSEYVLRYYKEIDKILGDLNNLTDENTTVLILSDHGFCRTERLFFINQWLKEKGILKTKGTNCIMKFYGYTRQSLAGRSLINFSRRVFSYTADTNRTGFKSVVSPAMLYNKDKTRAFAVKASSYAGIFITSDNMEEANGLRKRIKEGLSNMIDPDTNIKVIKNVYNKKDIYKGEKNDTLPDLIIEPEAGYVLETKIFDDILFKEPYSKYLGNHARKGIIAALGKDMKKGRLNREYSIIDMAATIISLMGMPVPAGLDSSVILEIFEDSYRHKDADISKEAKEIDNSVDFQGYSQEESEEVYARLKELGYID